MAKYGAKYLKFAPFSGAEPDAALPTYGASASLGELVKVSDSPTYITAKLFGDNKLVEDVTEFSEAGIDVEVCEITNSVSATIYGASNVTDLEHGGEDTAPFGGAAFYVNKMVNNVKKYQGVFYPKCKATVQGEEFATKGNNITLASGKMKFTAYTPNYGKWKIKSEDFTTEAQAKAWVDAKISATTYRAISVTVNGAGAGESVSPTGRSYVANASSFELVITGTVTALYDNGTESKASISNGKYTLANVTAAHDIVVIF